jgi:hypothetical protein
MARASETAASAAPGELRVRLDAVERDVGHVEQQVNAIRDTMATKADISSVFTQLQGLATQFAQQTKPNYGILISICTLITLVLGMLGGFAYWPISTATGDLKTAVVSILDKGIFQKQYDADLLLDRENIKALRADLTTTTNTTIQQQRYNAEMARIESEITTMRTGLVARAEHEEKWRSADAQHKDMQEEISTDVINLQRQLDELNRKQSDTYTTRDALIDLKKRVDRLQSPAH